MPQEAALTIVIPTHNRRDSLLRALDSLSRQTCPAEWLEAVVVDDGSTDGTGDLQWNDFNFPVHYCRQERSGATEARNRGALRSSAPVLVFMDDDIEATPELVEHLVEDLSGPMRVIVLAELEPVHEGGPHRRTGAYARRRWRRSDRQAVLGSAEGTPVSSGLGAFVHFTKCMTGVLAIYRDDFMALGMFQDPTGGWPNWDDVDFGYRAHLQGYRLWRSSRAVAYHHDHSLRSLEARCDRWQRASHSAARLFQRYPELEAEIPMYRDKAPIAWRQDSPRLIARKLSRQGLSSRPSVWAMGCLASVLERLCPSLPLRHGFHRWIVSACIYRGYRQGMREQVAAEE